jgi:hypothetical protein
MAQFALIDLCQRFRAEHPRLSDPLILLTQLGVRPDLRFLRDGLRLSRGGISAYADELAQCLRAVPGARLDVEDMLQSLDALASWVDRQGWKADDPRLEAMARVDASAPNPNSGYCLGILHHWSNLFYTLEPPAGARPPKTTDSQPYEELMAEFSTYVVAAQSTIDPVGYLAYCTRWVKSKQQPETPPIDDSRLARHVADASRAMRKITLVEHRALFDALVDLRDELPFHARVHRALLGEWNPLDEQYLEAVAKLLEDVKPGWLRPGAEGVDRESGTRISSQRTVRQRYRDGYVRIAESDVIAELIEVEDGLSFEILRPLPPSLEKQKGSKGSEVEGKDEEESDRRRQEALEEADGQDWIPAADRVRDDMVEVILLTDDDRSVPLGSMNATRPSQVASRWAQQHLRRSHFAHALWRERLRLSDVRTIFAAMHSVPADSENGPVLTCQHAAIATGRSLEAATKLEIVRELPRSPPKPDALCYHLDLKRWMLPVPPPAWNDMTKVSCERPVWVWLHLSDATGFHELLTYFSLATAGRPVERLTPVRKKALIQWLQAALPDAPPSMNACRQFLFHRLLAVNQGDLGAARLITGQPHSHAESVAHYAHYDAPVLWRAYQNAWRVAPKPRHVKSPSSRTPGEQNGYGARRVPKFDAVRDLLSDLRAQIRIAEPLIQHNLYTAYTLCGMVLGLGMRPVREPHLLDFGEQGLSALFLTYLDKARSDYHRRVNALPPLLATHLERYGHHLRTLDRFGPLGGKPLPRFRYFSGEGLDAVAFRPSHFKDLVGSFFALELYSLRRFARTYLLSIPGVEGEDVDAFMGHWHERVSPHDPMSTYPMRRLQRLADGPVNEMLKALGFTPLWMPT